MQEIKYKIIRIFKDDNDTIYTICKKANNHNFITIQKKDATHKKHIEGTQNKILEYLRNTIKRPLYDMENTHQDKWLSYYK